MAGRIKVCLESNDHVFKVKPIILIVHFVLFISAAGFNHRSTQKAYFNQGCDLPSEYNKGRGDRGVECICK